MNTLPDDRLRALQILNDHFKDEGNLGCLEDRQIKLVLDSMEEYAKAYAPVPGKEEIKIPSHNMFMAGGNTKSEKDFYQLGYSAAMQEKQSNEDINPETGKEYFSTLTPEKFSKHLGGEAVQQAAKEYLVEFIEENFYTKGQCMNEEQMSIKEIIKYYYNPPVSNKYKNIEQAARDKAQELHDIREKRDGYSNPVYYEGAQDGFLSGASFNSDAVEFGKMVERIYEVVGRDFLGLEEAVILRLKETVEIALKYVLKESEEELKFLNYFANNIKEWEQLKKTKNSIQQAHDKAQYE